MLKLLESPCIDTARALLFKLPQDLYTAYTLFSLLDGVSLDGAWVQMEENAVTALVVKPKRQEILLAASDAADFEELRLFLRQFRGAAVLCRPEVAAKIGIKPIAHRTFMVLNTLPLERDMAASVYDGLAPIYALLAESTGKPFDEQDCNLWVSKTARGIFGGYTAVRAVYDAERKPRAVAAADFFGDFVYIRDVATDKVFRGRGCGSACVQSLCKDLKTEQNTVFLLCDADKTEEFYKKSGFLRKSDLELGIVE